MASPREIFIHSVPSLFKAAEEGDIRAFNEYRSRLNLLRILTPNNNTLLHIHIITQSYTNPESTDFVENILNLCPSLLLQANTKGETPLHLAARYGCFHTVKLLFERAKALHEGDLERGMEEAKQLLTMPSNQKDTALHEAVRFNHIDVVELLIKEDPHFSYSANDSGETPLYLAAERGFGLVVSKILQTCTSLSHAGPNALTALHASVIRNDKVMTRDILRGVKEGDITKKVDQQGWTPLHHAAYLGHVSIVELLLDFDKSAAYMAANRDGNKTALHIAASRGRVHIVAELISRCPACWELVDERGWNFYHFAAKSDYLRKLYFSLESPSLRELINEKDNDGNTPFHLYAASTNIKLGIVSYFTADDRVDKMAFNNENLNALDITLTNDKMRPDMKSKTISVSKEAGARFGQRTINAYKYPEQIEDLEDYIRKEEAAEAAAAEVVEAAKEKETFEFFIKAKDTHLIVATLVATVTFAAGFTLPGGYISDKGRNQGSAILTRKATFKAFVISDTLAFALSISSVFVHSWLALAFSPYQTSKARQSFILAFCLTTCAIGAMFVAFITGLYAVLEQSSEIAGVVCLIGYFFFLFLCYQGIKNYCSFDYWVLFGWL